ncbi:hypothetical protein TSOC_010768 [Tetrabaena socialis]|uniref:Uncharacterized protein n=1 Tax=Tetrabaena socialis TaxID=47790 RepID=A0A2J7ZSD8_9CHLO|nr:hypothetical protein TSOC_010768 [Tetrabaena socialis]|eukprot:PNH03183.1 hypothetical protein TSOC_010768 [Tetrabaena socialis]
MATVFSLSSAVLDGTVGLLIGYLGLTWTVMKASCQPNFVTNMCIAAVLTIYIMLAPPNEKLGELIDREERARRAEVDAKRQLRDAPAVAAQPSPGKPESKKKK